METTESKNERRNELTVDRIDYLQKLEAIHDWDAESLHDNLVPLRHIFDELASFTGIDVPGMMDNVAKAIRYSIEPFPLKSKGEIFKSYTDINRLAIVLSRHNDTIHGLRECFNDIVNDLELIM